MAHNNELLALEKQQSRKSQGYLAAEFVSIFSQELFLLRGRFYLVLTSHSGPRTLQWPILVETSLSAG